MQHLANCDATTMTRSTKHPLGLLIAILATLTQTLPSGASAQDEAPLQRTIRSHWVRPNADGDIEGRISTLEMNSTIPLEQLEVSLVKDGNKLYTQTTNADGLFSFSDVTPDIYTLIASGNNGFMAYGIEVVPRPDDGVLDLDFGKRETAKKAFYTRLGLPAGAIVQDDLQIDAAAIPPTFKTMQQLTRTFLQGAGVFAVDVKAIGNAEEVSGGFKYTLSDDGSFKGKLQPIGTKDGEAQSLSDMNIFLIQNDNEIGRVPVEENGTFELKDVDPGIYAIVAAGKDGFAALSMELVASKDGDVNVNAPKRGMFKVAARLKQADLPAIGIAIVTNPADIQVIQQEVQQLNFLNQPMANFAGPQAPFGPGANPGLQNFAPSNPSFPSSPGGGAPPASGGFGSPRRIGPLGVAAVLAPAIAIPIAVGDGDTVADLPPASPDF